MPAQQSAAPGEWRVCADGLLQSEDGAAKLTPVDLDKRLSRSRNWRFSLHNRAGQCVDQRLLALRDAGVIPQVVENPNTPSGRIERAKRDLLLAFPAGTLVHGRGRKLGAGGGAAGQKDSARSSGSSPRKAAKECPICLVDTLPADLVTLGCGHYTCGECAVSWANSSGTGPRTRRISPCFSCPTCRTPSRFSTAPASAPPQNEKLPEPAAGGSSSGSHRKRPTACDKAPKRRAATTVTPPSLSRWDAVPATIALLVRDRVHPCRGGMQESAQYPGWFHVKVFGLGMRLVQLVDASSGELVGEDISWCRAPEPRQKRRRLSHSCAPAAETRATFDGAGIIGCDVSLLFAGFGRYWGMVCSRREDPQGRWKYTLCFHADSNGTFAKRGDRESGSVVEVAESRVQTAFAAGDITPAASSKGSAEQLELL